MRYLETLKEAKMTGLSLLTLIIFWLLAGILLSGVELTICNIPIWAIVGTIGVWTMAIILAITISKKIKDVEL